MDQNIEKLIIPKEIIEKAEEALKNSKEESIVFLFGKNKNGKNIATDILIPSENDYEIRTCAHVAIRKEFIAKEFQKFKKENKTQVATIHSHPLNDLSLGDIETHKKVIKFYPYQLSGIYNGNFSFYQFKNGKIENVPYKIIDLRRFDRQIRIFGIEGQLLISSSTIALIGVGGGNTKIALDLASLGIGKLILIDPDVWEEHNRNRVFIPSEMIGQNKAITIGDLIKKYYPDVEIESYNNKVQEIPDKVFEKADIIVVGPDNFHTRIYGNRLALRLKKTAVFPAAGIESKDRKISIIGGSVQVVIPGKTPCYECIHSIDSFEIFKEIIDDETREKIKQKYGLKDEIEIPVAPSIVALNDIIGGIALWEIIKILTGIFPIANFQIYNALNFSLKEILIEKKENCPACSPEKHYDEVETKEEEFLLSALKSDKNE